MAGLGLVGAYGVAGADAELRRLVEERLEQQARQQAIERQSHADARSERHIRLQEENARQNRASLIEQREALADQRRQNAAHTLAGDLAIGDVLDPQQSATLRGGNFGSNIDHQAATLGNRAMGGFGTMPSMNTPSRGVLRTVSQPAQPERDVYRGTPTQRRAHEQQRGLQQWMESLPPNSPERRTLEYQMRTGNNPPAGFIDNGPTDRYSAHPMFDESGEQIGVSAFNSATGEFKPVKAGGFIRTRTGGGGGARGSLPPRVEGFLLQLRNKHRSYDDALSELTGVLANAPGETFSRVAASNALRQLYAQPTGRNDALDGLDIGSILSPGSSQGARPQPQATSGSSMTRAELRAVAQQLGISEREAEQQAAARGMQVR